MQVPMHLQMADMRLAAASGSAPAWAEGGANMSGLLRLRGLPFNATPEQVLQFFAGFELPRGPAGIHMVLGPNGRPNGEAFVELGAEDLAESAMSRDRQTMGSRYVEVFRSTPDQMAAALHRAGKSNNMAPGLGGGMGGMGGMGGQGVMGGPGADAVVKMRGLPYKVKVPDVLDFFSPAAQAPLHGVHLMFNDREQPTGEAFVEFASSEERERAMTKDREHMEGRYVELFRVNRGEMWQALEQFAAVYQSHNSVPQMMAMGGVGGAMA